jgi:hypothetical protein
MENNLLTSGRRIAADLGRSEMAIEAALIEHAALLATIVKGGADNKIAPAMTGPALARTIDALSALSTARERTVECHAVLAKLRDEFGLSASDTGCDFKKKGPARERSRLRAVAA